MFYIVEEIFSFFMCSNRPLTRPLRPQNLAWEELVSKTLLAGASDLSNFVVPPMWALTQYVTFAPIYLMMIVAV